MMADEVKKVFLEQLAFHRILSDVCGSGSRRNHVVTGYMWEYIRRC
jgi:hypothetical protein